MNDKIVNIDIARDRRTCTEIEVDQAQWDHVRNQLFAVMYASKLNNNALTSATLNALLDALQPDARDDAKQRVAQSLAAFF